MSHLGAVSGRLILLIVMDCSILMRVSIISTKKKKKKKKKKKQPQLSELRIIVLMSSHAWMKIELTLFLFVCLFCFVSLLWNYFNFDFADRPIG